MNWCISESGFDKEKIEFLGSKLSVGNGYMGYRGTLQEYGPDQLVACTISEIFDDNGSGWREPINMPNGLYTVPKYNGNKLSVLETEIIDHKQELHIDAGRQCRETTFKTADGKHVTVAAEQFASLDNYHLLLMKYSIKSDSDIDVSLSTSIDNNIWNINGNHFAQEKVMSTEGVTGLVCTTIQDGHELAIGQKVKVVSGDANISENGTTLQMDVSLKCGETFTFEKYVAVCKDTDCDDVWKAAIDNCSQAYGLGYDEMLKRQKECWDKRYANLGIKIDGDEEAQQAIYYSCYLLYSSAPEHSDRIAIPARGLSGQVYKGAYFWDTEIYMLPMFAYCAPKIAKNLVMYRVYNLEGAYEKAQEYGYRGAFFPWESQENGKDGCTHYNLTDIFTGRKMRTYFRDKQVHISADVAYGIWEYVSITGDYSILLEGGAEVILECARFFNSYAYFKKDKNRYELLDVTGADEYHERVNNDVYTNYMVWLNAKIALEVVDWLKENYPEHYHRIFTELDYWGEIEAVKDMYDKIYLPQPNKDGVLEQYDTYFKQEDLSIEELYSRIIEPNEYLGSPVGLAVNTQILKQADVVMIMSLLSELFTEEVRAQNWAYYEPRTEHGSSLSTCIYALTAAQIDKTEWAYKFLMKAAQLDLLGNYKQYLGPLYIGGTHPAANGGTWMVTVMGFGGLKAVADGIILNPHLPEKWNALEFAFQYDGFKCKAAVSRESIEVTVDDSREGTLHLIVRGNDYYCEAGKSISVPY